MPSRLYSSQSSLEPSQGETDSRSQSMLLSQLSNPKSHPIQITGDDVEHSLSTLELAQAPLEQPWDHMIADQLQTDPSLKHKQHTSKPLRSHSRNSSFSSTVGEVLPGKPKGHRRSNSGEQPATSHFVLPARRPHGRAVMQEPPLSTRSSYRMEAPWENAAQQSARSFGQGSTGQHNICSYCFTWDEHAYMWCKLLACVLSQTIVDDKLRQYIEHMLYKPVEA